MCPTEAGAGHLPVKAIEFGRQLDEEAEGLADRRDHMIITGSEGDVSAAKEDETLECWVAQQGRAPNHEFGMNYSRKRSERMDAAACRAQLSPLRCAALRRSFGAFIEYGRSGDLEKTQ